MPTTDDEEAPVDPRTIPRGAEVRLPPGAQLPSGARPRPRPRRAEEGAPSGALEALHVADEAPGEVPYHVALERSTGGPGSYELRFKVGDLVTWLRRIQIGRGGAAGATRIFRGDRRAPQVECRCGPTDYIPATVVQLWYQDTEEDNEGMPSWYSAASPRPVDDPRRGRPAASPRPADDPRRRRDPPSAQVSAPVESVRGRDADHRSSESRRRRGRDADRRSSESRRRRGRDADRRSRPARASGTSAGSTRANWSRRPSITTI